ncbi:MAG: hypothetical protein ACR2O4_10600 [Hyphomicrobiaceae bacterium]
MRLLALTAIATGLLSVSAVAQENPNFCVLCLNPEKNYACEVIPPGDGVMAQSPQIFCAQNIAKSRGHASCAVQRNGGETCQGEAVLLAYTGPLKEPETETVTTQPEEQQPPKTLIEATDRAVKSSGKQIKKAGRAVSSAGKTVGSATKKTGEKITETGKAVGKTVGKAAKSTWDCVVSLFQSC